MKNFEVFEDAHEQERLQIQFSMLRRHELPVYEKVLSDMHDIRLLDVGCSDGAKTVELFSRFSIDRLIGLECSEKMAVQAQNSYGSEHFSFYCCDVEDDAFPDRLSELVKANNIDKFDVINISYVLLHLKRPDKVLALLKSFLSVDGVLIIEEAYDSLTSVFNDTENLFGGFLSLLDIDPLAGNRHLSKELERTVNEAGYRIIETVPCRITADSASPGSKSALFDIFCSYLPEDIALLRQQQPDNADYISAEEWLKDGYERLRQLAVSDKSGISIGFLFLVCRK